MKKKFLLIFLCIPVLIFCQNPLRMDLRITDTLVIKKKSPNATKVNVEIDFPDFQDTMFLYLFNKCVQTTVWYNDSIAQILTWDTTLTDMRDIMGLAYLLTGEDEYIIQGDFSFVHRIRNHSKYNSTGIFVNSRQQFIKKRIKEENIHEHFLSKYEITGQKQKVVLYPLLDKYFKDLPKGEYYLFFVYSFNPKPKKWAWFDALSKDPRTFKGRVFSNKVKLIVK